MSADLKYCTLILFDIEMLKTENIEMKPELHTNAMAPMIAMNFDCSEMESKPVVPIELINSPKNRQNTGNDAPNTHASNKARNHMNFSEHEAYLKVIAKKPICSPSHSLLISFELSYVEVIAETF